MRITAVIIVILVLGGALAAYWLFDNRAVGQAQLETITTACPQCHGKVPAYEIALTVHNKHAAFNCSQCHSDVGGLKATDSFHLDLKWAGTIIGVAAVITLIVNFIINGKGKAK